MSKNGAGFDPAIEDVWPVDDEPEDVENVEIVESALIPKMDGWYVHVKFSKGDAREYTLDDYNKMVPVPIKPPYELPIKSNLQ